MKVLSLTHMFPNRYDPVAGAFVREQARALRAAGVEVTVFSPLPWAPRRLSMIPGVRKYIDIPRQEVVDGFTVYHPRVPTLPRGYGFALSGVLFWLACRGMVREYLRHNPVDLIHAHTIMPDGFGAVLLGREFKLPVVCTVHGSDVKIYPYQKRSVRLATEWALRKVGPIVAVSENLRRCTLRLSGPRQVHVAKNGADPEVFRQRDKQECRAALGLPSTAKVVTFVGYLRPDKRVTLLLDALAKLNNENIHLCLAGDGSERGALQEQAARLGMESRCHFAGAQPHERVAQWMSAADCVVLCSLSEGLPTVLPEAMLCRVPVIATPVGGVPEIVQDGETGLLVPVNDVTELANALERVLFNEPLAAELARNAYAYAKDELTWQANARRTIAVFEEALGRCNASALVRDVGCAPAAS